MSANHLEEMKGLYRKAVEGDNQEVKAVVSHITLKIREAASSGERSVTNPHKDLVPEPQNRLIDLAYGVFKQRGFTVHFEQRENDYIVTGWADQ